MNILVLVKEVPDMEKVKFDRERGVVDRSSAEAEMNPFDENALQAAVDQKKKGNPDVFVTVMTMGPQRAEKMLRDAYARGADQAVLLTDRKFGGSDTCATAKTLAAAIKKTGPFDLILCGEKSVDGDTAQVGAEVAEFLNIPHAYYVEDIRKLDMNSVQVAVENMGGNRQIRTMRLPALIGVTKNISRPELPTVKRKLESLEIPVKVYTLQDLNGYLTEEETGFKGSPTKVSKIEIPKAVKKSNRIYREEFTDFLKSVTDVLAEKGIV
ncbi:electron transfer flavoprotein subunit beta/FixA family protein [Sinanaerobacter sp. ZZT-01]|uniref:electron transfer flavoprotein subunit beta/FixA family protein n=1 Tax=Sinanaerobacter sp. ZZT-01 TaxID=3111540 RepID=UPI002D7731AE|nr:electron transfer flavoprotein subunit beta/FixA family protein [Sinanaerobacter sp. ZZT-01]WRR92501.1 electron transfer flavoprotein subunit beta/FixA family protein [Sinanaerobacter sp. ZZT-01]